MHNYGSEKHSYPTTDSLSLVKNGGGLGKAKMEGEPKYHSSHLLRKTGSHSKHQMSKCQSTKHACHVLTPLHEAK